MKFPFFPLLIFLLITCYPSLSQTNFSPTGRNRMAAEWEPALGTIITWPLSIPYKLVIELAKDDKLFIMVPNENAQKDAVIWLSKWHVDPRQIKFIRAPQGIDAFWVRDWGPHAVFTTDGTMKLADGKYIYATPVTGFKCDDPLQFIYLTPDKQIIKTEVDDKAPAFIGLSSDLDMLELPFAFTGGNVISDGQGSAFSTCIITNENLYEGESVEKFLADTKALLGIENYHLISNFESNGIQHIDCFMKMLDEERLLVMRPPADHPLYKVYENIVTNELSKLKDAYGRPYQILRLDTDRFRGNELAAYSNSLIINKTVYVPLFGINQDSVALAEWAAAMPGYKIKGFEYQMNKEPTVSDEARRHYGNHGWNGGDALHCRTRAMWDPKMLYMSVDRIQNDAKPNTDYLVSVIIKAYSKMPLVDDSLKLSWRIKGTSDWNEITLKPDGRPDAYFAIIPGTKAGMMIEYFASAKDKSGRSETMPRTAPDGLYQFNVVQK
ncbi:MAG: agmatine deiminase family protein [Saprospiraceae bacterium]